MSANEGFGKGLLSTTQKLGIIAILPKEDKCREYLKHWRPISLLNVSYKLISACIANRLKQILDYIINENQKGFLKGRFIGENTRFVYDIINETKIRQIPGMILLIDFEKAFDSISCSKHLNFSILVQILLDGTKEPESIEHLFFYCHKSKQLWVRLEHFLSFYCHFDINFSLSEVIFGYTRK